MRIRQFSLPNVRVAMAAFAVCFFAANAFAAAPSEKVLYSFLSFPDGGAPQGALVADGAGNLYGTTPGGGSGNAGTVFELSPPTALGGDWTETILYNFQGSNDARPNGSMIFDNHGNLYGTALGACCGTFNGSVFELSPASGGVWTEAVLWSSDSSNQSTGYLPLGKLAIDPAGNLYGTNYAGGSNGYGVAYELLAPTTAGGTWSKRVLHNFGATGDGKYPKAGLLLRNGTLYGATSDEGTPGWGTVFQLVRKPGGWTETVLHSFSSSGNAGFYPETELIADNAGNLYGTNTSGGTLNNGTVFELSPPAVTGDPWQETTLHIFSNTGNDGAGPTGSLWRDKNNNLFGTTARSAKSKGTVFKLKPPATTGGSWTYVLLVRFPFSGDTPSGPSSGLTFVNGAFYGVSALGGTRDDGTVYSVVP